MEAGVKVRGARDSWTFMDAEVKGIFLTAFFGKMYNQ